MQKITFVFVFLSVIIAPANARVGNEIGRQDPFPRVVSYLPSADAVSGWACDPDATSGQPIVVHFYATGVAYGDSGDCPYIAGERTCHIGATVANLPRPTLAAWIPSCVNDNHQYLYTLPTSVKDGLQHWIYAV